MHASSYATVTAQADFSAPEDMRDQISVEGGYQPALERDVVVRRLRQGAADQRLRGRFLREVKALAQLRHHNFIHVYDAGVRDDVPFAVFERLHGITVQHRIELLADRQAAMELDEALWIVESVAGAVSYARQQGVRVYDLTPGNIVLAEDRRVVLTGLGEPLPENPLTAPALALVYAAPERLFGTPAAGNEDVYGLGVLLAHLVFGRTPFDGTAVSIIAQKQQLDTLPLLNDSDAALACPYPLAHLMHRATAADPRERLASVDLFVEALAAAANSRPRERAVGQRLAPRGYADAAASRPAAHQVAARVAPLGPGWAGDPYVDETSPLRLVIPAAPAARPAAARPAQPAAPALVPAPAPVAAEPLAAEPAEAGAPVVAAAVEPAAYDPQTPGFDDPTLAAALPFTLLVPMPEGAEEGGAVGAAHAHASTSVLTPRYVAVLLVLCALAIGAAMMFG
jgi:serine/threonine-protein kinase